MKTLDLGCGNKLRGPDGADKYGCDVRMTQVAIDNLRMFKCIDLITESPLLKYHYDIESFDIVYAYDLLEHIPTIWNKIDMEYQNKEESWDILTQDEVEKLEDKAIDDFRPIVTQKTIYPRIELMNAVWDILRPNGVFDIFVPVFEEGNPHYAWAQDPTHVDVPWTRESFNYFSNKGEWEQLQDLYDIRARFEITSIEPFHDTHIYVKLTKK